MSATTRSMPLERAIGLTGIAGMVVLFTGLIIGSPGEPQTDAGTAAAADFVKGLDRSWLPPVEALADIGMMVLLWFMVGLALLLRRYEGATPVRSTVAIVSAAFVAAFVVLDSAEEAGAHRGADLDQGQLAFAYDLTTIGFTNIWLPFGCFAFACGWIIVASNAMPRWLGRWGMIAGIALSFAQFVWRAGEFWYLPYIAVWLWILTTCVVLVRRPAMAATSVRAA